MPRAVLLLGLTSLLTDVGGEMIFPLLPAFLATLGAGPAFLGLLEGVADATASGLKLVAGAASDRAPRRKPFVVFGYGLAGLVRPLVALATAPWHVLAVRVLDRIGKGVRTAPRDALISAAVPDAMAGRAFGLHRAMDHAGAVIGPALAALLLSAGLVERQLFLLAALPGIAALVAVLLVPEATRVPAPVEVEANAPPPARFGSWLAILALFSLGNSSDAFLLLRASELGLSGAELPLLWMAFHVVKLLASFAGGALADRVDRGRLVASGWLVYAGSYLAFGLATQAWHAIAIFLAYGVFHGLTEPAEKALVKGLAPKAKQGRAFGLYHLILGGAAIPAGLLTGGLWQLGGAGLALSCSAAIAAAAAIALFGWTRRAR